MESPCLGVEEYSQLQGELLGASSRPWAGGGRQRRGPTEKAKARVCPGAGCPTQPAGCGESGGCLQPALQHLALWTKQVSSVLRRAALMAVEW